MRIIKICIIVVLILNTLSSYPQKWEREYGNSHKNDWIFAVSTYYDKGYVLGLRVNDERIWIIKTDINGEVLWSKFIISNENIYLESLDCSSRGEIVLTGAYLEFDENGDSFILKLDSCGNKAWCKVAQIEDGDYGRSVLFSSDGQIYWYTYGGEDNYIYNQIWKISNDGFAIWNKIIASRYEHPLIHSPVLENMYETSDQGLILSGSCYYPSDTNNPSGTYKLRSLLIKTDASGNEEWLLPAGYEENISGCVDDVVKHGDSYYAVGYRYDTSSQFTSPLFIKVSESGELLYHTVINQGDTLENYLIGIREINESSFILAGRTRRGEDSLKMGIFKTDTLGNIITWMENNNGSPIKHCLTRTHDNKFLVTGYSVHGSNHQGYAVKVNENIEFDSLYTHPYNYDTLCPYSIVSDTIFCDCDLLVSQQEIEVKKEPGTLKVYPNPAREHFIVSSSLFLEKDCLTQVFDLFGRKVKELSVPKNKQQITINVKSWQRGMYLVKVSSEQGFTESVKIILQ